MQMNDQREIKADPATVWAAILNPEVLKACVPGCETLDGHPKTGLRQSSCKRSARSRPASRAWSPCPIWSRQSLRITGEGKGGPAGFAKGGANVTLSPDDDGTLLSYEVEANVGGKLAQLGSRIIDGFAKKMADEFFTRFQAAVEGPEDLTRTQPILISQKPKRAGSNA